MSLSVSKSLKWVLAIAVLGIILLAIFGFPLKSLANFLPDFGDADRDNIIEGPVMGDFGDLEEEENIKKEPEGDGLEDEGIGRCVEDAFWADKDKNKIKVNEKISPGEIFFVVEMVDMEKCKQIKVGFIVDDKEGKNYYDLDNPLWTREGDFYYRIYEATNKPFFSKTYSFQIKDFSNEVPPVVFEGYKIEIKTKLEVIKEKIASLKS